MSKSAYHRTHQQFMALHAEAMQALEDGDYVAFGDAIHRRERLIVEHKEHLARLIAGAEKRMARWPIARD